jgi:hypothetical protein
VTTKAQPVQLLHILNCVCQQTGGEDHQGDSEHSEEFAHVELRTQLEDGEGHAQCDRESEYGTNQEKLSVYRGGRLSVRGKDDRQREDHRL